MKKVLIIEDDNKLRENVSELLVIKDYNVIQAEHGKEGIEKALSHVPDIILCDLMMPEMDGFEVIQEVKRKDELKNIPFIFLTAKSERADIRKGMALGADDYLTKPFSVQELVDTIETRLKKTNSVESEFQMKLKHLTEEINRSSIHEFSTPLNSILGFSDLIVQFIDSLSKEEIVKYSQLIYENGNRLKRILDNLMMFQKLKGKILLENGENLKKLCNLQDSVVNDIIKKIAIQNNRPEDLEIDIEADDLFFDIDHLYKVISEIVDNAFKFSSQNTKVKVIGKNSDKSTYQIQVIDEGIGFPKNQSNKIAPFQQFEREKYEQQGMGLGLFIASELLRIYGGHLDIIPHEKSTEISLKFKRAYP